MLHSHRLLCWHWFVSPLIVPLHYDQHMNPAVTIQQPSTSHFTFHCMTEYDIYSTHHSIEFQSGMAQSVILLLYNVLSTRSSAITDGPCTALCQL